MKPGYKTTEFWIALGGNVIGLLALSGVFAPGDVEAINANFAQIVGGVVAMITNATYIWSRTKVKASAPAETE